MLLTDLKVGEKAIVERFDDLTVEAVLTDMGCPQGTTIELYHKGLFRGPISIKTHTGSILALRQCDAQQMTMRKS
ncbi:MAG: FeoA family protein [Aureispira sp.]